MSKPSPLVTKFMAMSMGTAAFYGVATLFVPWSLAKVWMYPAAAASSEEGYNAFRFLLSACLLGWANGKYTAFKLGPSACVEFCKTNVVPMLLFVGASAKAGAWDTPVWAAFTAAYVHFGYLA